MLTFYHNSRDITYRKPFGSITCGEKVVLHIDAFDDCPDNQDIFEKAVLSLSVLPATDYDGENTEAPQMTHSEIPLKAISSEYTVSEKGPVIKTVFEAEFTLEQAGVCFYRFDFELKAPDGHYFFLCYANNNDSLGGVGRLCDFASENRFQITVTEKGLTVPDWFIEGIIYQIFPDRFCKGIDAMAEDKPNSFYYGTWNDTPMYIRDPKTNDIARWDFHRGNLSGVTGKLPYIEALGANIIYLNPIFKAVSNHRYDTADYMHVDGMLGGDPAFDILVAAAEREGVKIMLDGVFSHTGSDSIYFDKEHKYGNGAYQNPASPYRSWYRFSPESDDDYESWWGVKVLPNVEELNPGYLDYIVRGKDSVIKHWIKKGISGWRLDVADELPDKFIHELRLAAEDAGDEMGIAPVVLGEVWEDASNKISYDILRTYFTRRELHTVTNYPFRKTLISYFTGKLNAETAKNTFMSLRENYPVRNFYALVNMTGTHDVKRLMTELLDGLGNSEKDAATSMRGYAAIMFTFPGVPLVYYGDETMLQGGEDPDNRRTYPWGNEDTKTVEFFGLLGNYRRKNKVLSRGEITFKPAGGKLAFVRNYVEGRDVFGKEKKKYSGADEILTVVSNDNAKTSVTVSDLVPNSEYKVMFNLRGECKAEDIYIVSNEGVLEIENFQRLAILEKIG